MKYPNDALKVVVLLLALTMPALAQKPTIMISLFTPTVIPSDICGFGILVTPQVARPNLAKIIFFANSGISSGPVFITLENLTTHKTVDLNISGPVTFNFTDTYVLLGPGLAIEGLPPDVATAAGLPKLPLFHGRAVFKLDDLGNITAASFTGRVDDACQIMQ
jgi:hypothetical protein